MRRSTFLSAILLLAASGCGSYPDRVSSAAEVSRLPRSTYSVSARSLPDADVSSLDGFRDLVILDFSSGWGVGAAEITDAGLETLSGLSLPSLETLDLGYNDQITDSGLVHLTKMNTVQVLLLHACPKLTDQGLAAPASMQGLLYLDLRGSKLITDAGLLALANLRSLKTLILDGAEKITSAGVAELQKRMPGTRIVKDDAAWAYLQRH